MDPVTSQKWAMYFQALDRQRRYLCQSVQAIARVPKARKRDVMDGFRAGHLQGFADANVEEALDIILWY